MATQPPVSGDGAPPPARSPAVSYLQAMVELHDWWLERVEGEEGKFRVVGFNTTTSRAGRIFTSASIKRRHANGDLETVDGAILLIKRPPNISKMNQNGFPHEVSKHFWQGFPVQWEKIINSNTTEMMEQPESPQKSAAYYIEKFLKGKLKYSMGLFAWDDTFQRTTNEAGIFPNQSLCNSSNERPIVEGSTANTLAASEEFCTGRMDIPKKPLATPGETCHSNQTNHVSSGLEGCETPKCVKATPHALKHLETKDALEITIEGMDPQSGVCQGSKDNTVRRLRNGKVIGMSSSASMKKTYKRRMQDKTFSENIITNEDVTSTTGQISHENVDSVSVQQIHDAPREGRERKRGKRMRS
uniref:SANTA domain-containing protein n=1 Tax=Leersia perrieri TaxID=77586 RepID=A0A0D9W3L9_9ORYZ